MDGMKIHAKKKIVVYSKVKTNSIFSQKTRFGFKSHNGVLCLHTEVTNWAPYSSHMHQMKRRYTGYIYRNTRTSCSIHKRSHISIFFYSCSFLQCGRPDFHHWKFPMKHVLLRSRYKTYTRFRFGITSKYPHSEISRKTQNVYRPLIHHIKFCTKNILYNRAHCERYRRVITTLIIDKERIQIRQATRHNCRSLSSWSRRDPSNLLIHQRYVLPDIIISTKVHISTDLQACSSGERHCIRLRQYSWCM